MAKSVTKIQTHYIFEHEEKAGSVTVAILVEEKNAAQYEKQYDSEHDRGFKTIRLAPATAPPVTCNTPKLSVAVTHFTREEAGKAASDERSSGDRQLIVQASSILSRNQHFGTPTPALSSANRTGPAPGGSERNECAGVNYRLDLCQFK